MNIARLKAALFDLDDTLCDDSSCWADCSQQSAQMAARENPAIDARMLANAFLELSQQYWTSEEPTRETRSIFDVRSAQWLRALEMLGYTGARSLSDRLAEEYGKRRSTEIALFPDAVFTLDALRGRGIAVAVVTNGFISTHVAKVASLDLRSHVDHVVIAEEFGCFKPDVRIFRHALDLCKCKADETIMVGDDLTNDIGGAEAAGIRSYWFNPKGLTLPSGAPVPSRGQIRSLSELLDFAPA